jgi:hypothetical protein
MKFGSSAVLLCAGPGADPACLDVYFGGYLFSKSHLCVVSLQCSQQGPLYSLASKIICHTKCSNNAGNGSCKLPVKFAFTVLLIGAVADGDGCDTPDEGIANHDRVIAILAELLAIRLEGSFGLLRFLGDIVFGFAGLLGRFLRKRTSFGLSFLL